ncbi:MAG: UvrD-helicase domain-containing protein, partial [Candidatus Methanoperedens sp.]|nr:UvrD-helicase domain-containing protein [Candidatus Methanoperedens sp.]
MERKQEKIAPERILALAFQKKAGKEIEDRLSKRFGIGVKIKTFHSFGYEILSKPKLKFDTDEFIDEL